MKHVLKTLATTLARTLAFVTAMLLSMGAVQAEVVDFETAHGLSTALAPVAPMLLDGDTLVQGNFVVIPFTNADGGRRGDLVGALVDGNDLSLCAGVLCPTNNASTFYAGLNDGVFALQSLSRQTFSVASFDASFIGAQGAVLPPVSGLLRLQGVIGAVSLVQTFQLAGPDAGGALSFSSYATSGAFATTKFDTVYVFGFNCDALGTCNAFSSNQAQFAIDNINLNVTPVPEPETWALFGIGLAGIAAAARRRRLAA